MITFARFTSLALLFLFSCISRVDAQPANKSLWQEIRRYLLPDELAHVYELRAIIGSFTEFSHDPDPRVRQAQDLSRLDSMYLRAIALCEGDIQEALVVIAAATLPYHTFPAVVPLTGIVFWVPVSTESAGDFNFRLHALPSQLFLDTPIGGDRDKLPHFFGSAWLYSVTKSNAIVTLIGRSVEIFESLFKLEGAFDERDMQSDSLGIEFAKQIMENNDALPSHVFLDAGR